MTVRNIQSENNKFRKYFTATLLQTLNKFMTFYSITMFSNKDARKCRAEAANLSNTPHPDKLACEQSLMCRGTSKEDAASRRAGERSEPARMRAATDAVVF